MYKDQILRSFGYAFSATVLCILLAFPLAYVIAFKSGRYKNLLLGLVILPFFVTFLIRTLAWKTILADDGWVVQRAQRNRAAAGGRPPALDQLGGDRRAAPTTGSSS